MGAVVPGHVGVVLGADVVHELPDALGLGHGAWAVGFRDRLLGQERVLRGERRGLGADTGGRPAPVRRVSQAWNLLFQLRGVPEGGLGVIHGSLLDDFQQFFVR